MAEKISLRDANQQFARLVRQVESGREFVITRHGQPVARIVPAGGKRVPTAAQEAAWRRVSARMRKGWDLGGGKIDRDSLYDDV
jgi:prevent-host-death family protein